MTTANVPRPPSLLARIGEIFWGSRPGRYLLARAVALQFRLAVEMIVRSIGTSLPASLCTALIRYFRRIVRAGRPSTAFRSRERRARLHGET